MDAGALRFQVVALLLLLASACSLKEEASLVLPQGKDSYFVEAYLAPGAPVGVSLTRTNNFQDDLSLRLVWYASASLSTTDTVISLSNMFFRNSSSGKLLNYVNPYIIPSGAAEDSIRIQIISESGGDTLYAATERVEPIKIKQWTLQNQVLQVSCNNGTSPANRYYSLFVESIKENKTMRKLIYYDYSHVEVPDLSISIQVSADEQLRRVIFYRITSANYQFQVALQQASRSNVDPFEPPVRLPTNIRGGEGIFTYCTADTLKFP